MRLDKYLADMQIGTRKELKNMIRKGRVSRNEEVIRDPGLQVAAEDRIFVDGKAVFYTEYEYLMLNKPAGVISATEDAHKKTVLDLLGEGHRKDLFPVGRLDIDTVGLLLLTNDGALSHQLLSPKHHVDKTYYAIISGIVTEEDVRSFAEGLIIDTAFTALPAKLTICSISEEKQISEVEITIQEGKFHQVKRMFQALGKEVQYLKRLRMGPLELDPNLSEGAYRPLTDSERESLFSTK